MIKDQTLENEYEELLLYLYDLAASKYSDHEDVDALIQDTVLAYIVKCNNNETVEHPKGFLSTVMKNKYNAYLRRKYRERTVYFDDFTGIEDELCDAFDDEASEFNKNEAEYAAVRREIGRLIAIYREVTVRYYINGHSVERIANELGISQGTVKSRLSSARGQIKEGIKNMEKYAKISYAPKNATIGIWGNDSMVGEPFILLHSQIEGNILCLAYEKPLSVRDISDAMGIPVAYLEPLIDRLIEGELMGRSEGGRVYTRCFVEEYKSSFGDVPLQERLAEKYAESIWEIVRKHTAILREREQFLAMSEKQKAMMLLFVIDRCINRAILKSQSTPPPDWSEYPVRPNGGRWWAILTVSDHGEARDCKYSRSGPVNVGCCKNNDGKFDCKMYDLNSCFGEAHWRYSAMKYNVSLQSVARFYASLAGCDVQVDSYMAELVPEFEKLHVLRRGENGEIALDIPALTFDESRLWNDAIKVIRDELYELMKTDLTRVYCEWTHKVPSYVDGREYFIHDGALKAFSIAAMLAISERKLIPYAYEVGETPIIFLEYQKKQK